MTPIVPLYSYQRAWLQDDAPAKIACWARQTGKSFCATLEAVLDCVAHRRQLWVMISRGERQAMELLGQAARHTRACRGVFAHFGRDDWQPTLKQNEITFPNDSRLLALPANPDTVRGYSGHVLLDEFAMHGSAAELWRATAPITTRGYKLRVLSTPRGAGGRFYELWHDEAWSKHFVNLDGAIAAGLPADAGRLRATCADEETWLQEYTCEFLDAAEAFLPLDLIASCESTDCLQPLAGGRYYLGIDVGRVRDLTVAWVLEQVGDVYVTRVVETLRGQSFRSQYVYLEQLARRCVRTGIDATGLGMQLAEELHQALPGQVERVQFGRWVKGTPLKTQLAARARRSLEERRVRIPADAASRRDFHALRRELAPTGAFRLNADHTTHGHGDRFWAFALALAAGTQTTEPRIRWL